jgi:hypothetical protein
MDTLDIQARQKCNKGKARTNSDHCHIAESLARPVEDVERALGIADIALLRAGIQRAACLSNWGDQWVVDPYFVMEGSTPHSLVSRRLRSARCRYQV